MLLAQIVNARDVVDGTNWFKEHTGVGWTVAVIEFVVFCFFCAWFYRAKYRPLLIGAIDPRPAIRGVALVGFGQKEIGLNFDGELNGAAFWDFRDKYNVLMINGITDPKVDKYEDTRITMTVPHTITSGRIPIHIVIPELSSLVQKVTESKHHSVIETIWQEIVLLPKRHAGVGIRCLSDIERHGGLILSKEVAEGRVRDLKH